MLKSASAFIYAVQHEKKKKKTYQLGGKYILLWKLL